MSWKLFALLVEASSYTVLISFVSIAAGLVIGMLVCAAMLSPKPLLAVPARVFVSFFRGVPLLVQLLLLYNLLPLLGLNLPSVVAAIVGLSLCTAAYQAENLRGGFQSVSRGLLEAADMAGLDSFQRFRRIQVPIAFRLSLPALVNEAILILKASSLISVIGVVELTRMAQDLAASTYKPLELYAAAGFVYLVINWLVAACGRASERLVRWGIV